MPVRPQLRASTARARGRQIRNVSRDPTQHAPRIQFLQLIAVLVQHRRDNIARFRKVRRARYVRDDTAGAEPRHCRGQQLALEFCERRDILRGLSPPRFGPSSQCTEARARGIHEDSVVGCRACPFPPVFLRDGNLERDRLEGPANQTGARG